MRSYALVRTASLAVLPPLVLPLAVLAVVFAQLLVIGAPAQSLAPAPYAGAGASGVHVTASTPQEAGTERRECEHPDAVLRDAPRGRDRYRPGAQTPLLPPATRTACASQATDDRFRAGASPLPRRERPRNTTRALAHLQVFRC
ncbi:hypothetical protein [Streptomyces thermolilacinus]|uniref:Uncharacterized protein n=1 Tax=Streptomyces thermolilacinus SPC6 TaxID=1306406 RepID=A0A1D3DLT9_9ACTN|nr:hypothetical protein [Streptomyces thermolilacinus]OEJ93289.1 hypothetical protein J116_001150 [Streptomyces thermolilacinus SPC6]